MADQSPENERVLGEDVAVALLTGGPEGIAEWNSIVEGGTTEVPTLEEVSLAHRAITKKAAAMVALGSGCRSRSGDRSTIMAARAMGQGSK